MARKNPYLPATTAQAAKPVKRPRQAVKPMPAVKAPAVTAMVRLDDVAVSKRAVIQQAIADVQPNTESHSLAQATAHAVEANRYTPKETAAAKMAFDRLGLATNALSFVAATGFPGFPTLALLQQLPEYRSMCDRFADECVKGWGKVVSTGAATDGKLAAIEAELRRIDLRSVIHLLIAQEQAFGRAHACINIKNDDAYLTTPLLLTPNTIPKSSFEGVSAVEAYWVSPNNYNSIDPSKPDFYKPSSWWMLGREIHSTRFWTFVSRPVADMLKPAYSFAGVSMTQLAMPYVDNWLRTRQSVSDTVKGFSITSILMDLSQWMTPGGAASLNDRAQLINAYRDNRNLLLLDKNQEEVAQVNTPLSGLSELQAQAQEQQSSVSHIPLVILLGITPNGLNASSDGEFRAFYDRVLGYLIHNISPFILYIMQIVQLSLYAEVDASISWEWFPPMQETLAERSERQAKDADTDLKYIEAGVVNADKVAQRLASDPHSMYAGIGESLDDLDDTDIEDITNHILNMEPGAPVGSAQHGQAGSSENTQPGTLDNQASAISTPHSDPAKSEQDDPTRKRNNRRNMGV